jgi:CheY-like chemotaxis protein
MYKLLLADDSLTIQRVIELTFSGGDVQVVAVGDGEQAIARISTERPDIVLADIGMPKRSGYDVSAFVKDHPDLSHIPVLLLVGAFEAVDEARAERVRCDGVLVKPFEPQQVIARVHELIEGGKGLSSSRIGAVPRAIERLAPRLPERRATPSPASPAPASSAPAVPVAALPAAAPAITALPRPAVPAPAAVAVAESSAHHPDSLHIAERMASAASFRPPESGMEAAPLPALAVNVSLDHRAPADPLQAVPAAAVPVEEPRPAPSEAPPVTGAIARSASPREDSLEDYFDRLDAAFATLGNAPAGVTPNEPDEAGLELPTLDHLLRHGGADVRRDANPLASLRPMEPSGNPPMAAAPAPSVPPVTSPAPESESGGRSLLAQAFNALLAVEQGEAAAGPIRLTREEPPPIVTEAMVEEVTRRVLLRLSPESVRGVVADIVSEIAERLVREEIHRIRNGS